MSVKEKVGTRCKCGHIYQAHNVGGRCQATRFYAECDCPQFQDQHAPGTTQQENREN